MFFETIVGVILMIVGFIFWWAAFRPGLQMFFENLFGIDDGALFRRGKPYSAVIFVLRYIVFFVGLVMVIPAPFWWDIIAGIALAAIFFWMVRRERRNIETFQHQVPPASPPPRRRAA